MRSATVSLAPCYTLIPEPPRAIELRRFAV